MRSRSFASTATLLTLLLALIMCSLPIHCDEVNEELVTESANQYAAGCEQLGLAADGDMTLDGVVNVLDTLLSVSFVLKLLTPQDGDFFAIACKGDLNLDGQMDILDIVSIINTIKSG